MTTIYFAGKMGSGMGACDCGAESCHNHCEPEHVHKCGSAYMEQNWRYDVLRTIPDMEQRVVLAGGWVFGGPWFVDNHNHDMDADHVASRCLQWIQCCDAVFAWIGSGDAHGTFAELGYAKALGKPVFAAFDRARLGEQDERELWFIRQLSDGACVVRGVERAFSIFTYWLNARTHGHRW